MLSGGALAALLALCSSQTVSSVDNVLGVNPPAKSKFRPTPTRMFLLSVPSSDRQTCQRVQSTLFGFVESWRIIFNKTEGPAEDSCPHSLINTLPQLSGRLFSLDDVLVVFAPYFCPEATLPSICTELDPMDPVSTIIAKLNVANRTKTKESSCFILRMDASQLHTLSERRTLVDELTYNLATAAEPLVSAILEQYDLVLPVRPDSILLPAANHPKKQPVRQNGGFTLINDPGPPYATNLTRIIIPDYMRGLNMTHRNMTNLGETVYGSSTDVIAIAKSAMKAWKYLVVEDYFLQVPRRMCTRICKRNLSYYVNEMGINDVMPTNRVTNSNWTVPYAQSLPRTSILDSSSPMIVHAGITSSNIKATAFDGRHVPDNSLLNSYDYDPNMIDSFVKNCIWVGLWKHQREQDKYKAPVGVFPELEIVMHIQDGWSQCPRTHPYAYRHGCCTTAEQCIGGPLTEDSDCCSGSVLACLSDHCVSNRDGPFVTLEPDGVPVEADRCPLAHPYPYLKGTTCCSTNRDCGLTLLTLSSKCCMDDAYSKCASPPCRMYSD